MSTQIEWRTLGLAPDFVDYQQAWQLQRQLHDEVAAGQRGDVGLLLEHAPVYTAGKRTQDHERPDDGTQVVDVDRGGKITWHGPGQLVGYPLVKLPDPFGVVDYVRRIEEALIRVVTSYGIACGRVAGRSGVWLAADPTTSGAKRQERKIAAIGVRVAGGVTMHGFALNCNNDLTAFSAIIPCGITDAGVTSLTAELGRQVTPSDVIDDVRREVSQICQWQPYDRTPDIARAVPVAPPPAQISVVRPR